MSDVVPRLDDVEFDELVELARSAIPRYAPEWTDHNLHDPGMTLIDLFAWIVDQQVYRAGSVGGRHREAFAALLGARVDGPVPARGLVWPTGERRVGRSVALGSEVSCREFPELGFVLSWSDVADDQGSSLYLPAAGLERITPFRYGVPQPSPAVDGGGSWTLGVAGRTDGVGVTLRFDGPLHRAGQARVPLGIEVVPPPGAPPAAGDPPWGPVRYSYRAGDGRWTRTGVVWDGTAGLSGTGVVVLDIPPSDGDGPSEVHLALDGGFFPVPPQIRAMEISVLPVVQRRREQPPDPIAGTGLPDQVLALDTTDVVRTSSSQSGAGFEIEVDAERWECADDLALSGPDDPHYVVRGDGVRFGNGVNGRRPAVGAQIRHAGLSRTAGAAGNVRRRLTWSVPALGPDVVGHNPEALAGGVDRTTAVDLAAAARGNAVDRAALLTDDELATATRRLSGLAVGRAEVVDRFDRRAADRSVDGVRTVVVVPHQPVRDGQGDPPELLPASQAHLDAIATRLARRRVLGERIVVQGPTVVTVDLVVTVVPEAGAVSADVVDDVRRALYDRLAAVPDPGAEPWTLGRDLSALDLEVVAAEVPAVARVVSAQITAAGHPPGTDPVPVPRDGLVTARRVEVVVRDDTSGRRRTR